ncbi:phospholipase ABHD3-like, partial [Stegodyphus dumicola]|uniref:phospholipase ABHD3-like n=1 Tax=Stegodyphus dumicola TaxID=202533 RepID=UPI0015B18478
MSNMYFNITFLQESASLYPVNSEGLLVSTLFVVYLFYYILRVAKHPILVCQDGNFKSFLLDSCPVLQYRYWPTIWSFGSHAQTAIANMARGRLPDLPYKREILKMKDGGIVALDWLEADNTRHIVIFLPGVTGYSQTEYVKSLVPIAQKLGCRSVVFNNRGRGGVDIL